MRTTQLIVIFLLAITIVSCSLVKTAYNNAPEAMHWWLDDYFDFTATQNKKLKPALHALHDWHRQTQLPLYVELLQNIQSDLSKETIEPSAVCENMQTMQDMMQNIQLETTATVVEIAPLLSNQQLSYFQKKLEKRTLKWKSEWLQETREEQIEVRLEKTIDFAEKVYGNLNKTQKNMLKEKLLASNFKAETSYTEILRRNEDALQIVTLLKQENLDHEQKKTLVRQGFERLRNSPDPAYQSHANQVKQGSCEMIADLHATTDIKQKQHAKAWLGNFITVFKSLGFNKTQG
jgi:vacuolar-type H+-ATPase subunit I/STV1